MSVSIRLDDLLFFLTLPNQAAASIKAGRVARPVRQDVRGLWQNDCLDEGSLDAVLFPSEGDAKPPLDVRDLIKIVSRWWPGRPRRPRSGTAVWMVHREHLGILPWRPWSSELLIVRIKARIAYASFSAG